MARVDRRSWEAFAQTGEFDYHRKDKWRPSHAFIRQTEALFEHFGFGAHDYAKRTVIDLGAGSKLRTKYFCDARIIVIEPLADSFLAEIEWSDLTAAAAVYSVPAEDLVPGLAGEADLLVSINVLDHCFDFERVVENIRDYIGDDGLAFLSFDKHAEADEMHPLSLTEASCNSMFLERGLVVERMTTGLGEALEGAQSYGHGPYALNYWLRRAKPVITRQTR